MIGSLPFVQEITKQSTKEKIPGIKLKNLFVCRYMSYQGEWRNGLEHGMGIICIYPNCRYMDAEF